MTQKKICMVGAPLVGKTSLVSRYVHNRFTDKCLSTVGVKIDKKLVRVDGRSVVLILWDLAGDDDFQRLKLSHLRGTAGYVLVADGTRRTTLDHAVELQGRVAQAVGAIPSVLVVNKSDLAAEWEVDEARTAALTAEGWNVRRTSAKTGEGVETVFSELTEMMFTQGSNETADQSPA